MKSCFLLRVLLAAASCVTTTSTVFLGGGGGGGFEVTTDASSWADLALDIAAMRDVDDLEEKKKIYSQGRNAKYTDANGNEKVRSLASLSKDAYDIMKGDPMYSFFRHAFLELGVDIEGEQLGEFDNRPVGEYADTLIQDLFDLNITNIEAEAAIILNVWMYAVHELYEVLRACKRNDDKTEEDMHIAIDIVAALWIGTGQDYGENESGNLLYNLAENAGVRFDQDRGETVANTIFLDELLALKLGDNLQTCMNDPDGYEKLRPIVRRMIGQMTVPLVQILIHHLMLEPSSDRSNYIELYTLSIAPRVESCNPTAYGEMLQLFVRSNFEVSRRPQAINLLQSIYSCLEISCSQIGSYRSGDVPACSDAEDTPTIAGYPANFPSVIPYTKFDRDILQIKILTKARAYDAALDYYQYGYNVVSGDARNIVGSLKGLATSPARSAAAVQYDLFSNFFNDPNYADKEIDDLLHLRAPYNDISADQTMQLVTGTLQYEVMYMAILEKLYSAADKCVEGGDSAVDESVELLDQAVAFYTGSIEGSEVAGAEAGQLMYATSKQLCANFDTCVELRNSEVNDELIQAFAEMSNKLTLSNCVDVDDLITNDITPLLVVPLIQGALDMAVTMDTPGLSPDDGVRGLAEAFTHSLQPILNNVDETNTLEIEQNLVLRKDQDPVPDGANAVFKAFQSIIPKLQIPNLPPKCAFIGTFNSANEVFANVCDTVEGKPAPTPTLPPTAAPLAPVTLPPEISKSPVFESLTELGLGVYNFSTPVGPIAAIALDVRDIDEATSIAEANNTYLYGKHSRVTESDGTIYTVALANLSLAAAGYMYDDPMFNYFRWALLDEQVFNTQGDDVVTSDSAYADVVIQKALEEAQNTNLAAETTVVLHIWMEITHHLYDAIRHCNNGEDAAAASIDRATALWIGEGQLRGRYGQGYLMYQIAQQAAQLFGYPEGEADVNKNILGFLAEAKLAASHCSANDGIARRMRVIILEIIAEMTVPLVQSLLYHIAKANQNHIELYSLALVPQAVACGESTFETLRDTLLKDQLNINPNNLDQSFINEFRSFQKCLRITCEDIADRPITDASLIDVANVIAALCFNDRTTDAYYFAGYEGDLQEEEYARLDLDVLQIGILVETRAYGAAMDMYMNGWNSVAGDEMRSLSEIATSDLRQESDQFSLYVSYFNTQDFADEMVRDAIDGSGIFLDATRDQRGEIVTRALQCLVLYIYVLEKMYTALDACETDSFGTVLWGEAVAVYVGSMEGTHRGGSAEVQGTSLYSLAKEVCGDFGTCEASGDASVNDDIMDAFSDVKSMLASGDCAGAEAIVTSEITQSMPVPLVQGLLLYANENDALPAGSEDYQLATGFVFANAILPLVTNTTSATTIRDNMPFDKITKPVIDGVDAVFGAVTFALPGMKVNCYDVGSLGDKSVCNEEVVRSSPKAPTKLADGLYTSTTNVQERANIALDIVEIRNQLEGGSLQIAQDIYKDGSHSTVYDDEGYTRGKRSIASFSTVATTEMMDEPIFSIFRFALRDSSDLFLGNPSRIYADSLINQIFLNPSAGTLAAEAMVAMNIWMYLVHQLYQTTEKCKRGEIADDDGIQSIDEAAAYWIGDGQIAGDSERGHLLYALAEEMAENFNSEVSGQARSNTKIIRLLNRTKNLLSLPGACKNPDMYPKLRMFVNEMVSQMSVPLVQGLIHNLRVNDRDRVRMYAHAFAPLVSACNPTLYQFMREKLMGLSYNVVEVEQIVEKIRRSYDCLRISCEDVGQHVTETNTLCVDTPKLSAIAGYRPSNDVRQYALLDLDVYEIEVLMQMKAYNAAEELYTYGKHAVVIGVNGEEALTLKKLATTSGRTLVPQFDSYVRFFGDDNKYADTLVRQTFDVSKYELASDVQRTLLTVDALRFLVVYMAASEQMYTAVANCDSTDALRVIDAGFGWDRAAALLIGSMEGPEAGGTGHGMGLYNLAKIRCTPFGTCGPSGFSIVNEQIVSLLYTGKGALEGSSCGALRRAVNDMRPLLLIPLIQSNLILALVNEQLPRSTPAPEFAEGFIASRAILPLVEDIDRASADVISKNMDFQFQTNPVSDNAGAVFAAFANVYSGLEVDCSKMGMVNGIDPCSADQSSGASAASVGIIVGICIGVLGTLCIVGCVLFRRWRLKKDQETKPLFVSNENGIMNHTHDSDLLGGKYNDADMVESDEAFDRRVRKQVGELNGFSLT